MMCTGYQWLNEDYLKTLPSAKKQQYEYEGHNYLNDPNCQVW